MKLSDFDYYLPEELIAQTPADPRDSSRLMVLNRKEKTIEHRIFRDIVEYLSPGDLLVRNITKVIPARLHGVKETGARVEILLLEKISEGVWEALVKPGSKVKKGTKIILSEGIEVICKDYSQQGARILEFNCSDDKLFELGNAPLPPYIKNQKVPFERYQTVYSKETGSVAAPTAGLHFTEELLERLRNKGVEFADLILHVGLGTFRPVKVEDIREHKMHSERYYVPAETVKKIRETRKNKGRIIAVGTTSVRTLETIARLPNQESYHGKTDIFIYPPFEFKLTDAIITNFHLPKSTLLMLVSAFAGKDFILEAYNTAVKMKYRFFSLGDACFIY
ncbi:S-adenosylmethionine:tRNA ribosyltransferase-isomerase [Thermosipho africanus H17ap60334]|jgi:S-adenosylmethionine:tRNA ribosyltransferase-isomerase|uniref:tRNA preQ1(34) S-adenosylmethionine ribosyltransferase-isomerase QueA n=1 Tax=Thermosipho TaxID=2420 RepID=UPI00028E5CCE|nr:MULTISPECIES: tRNA preQ1(34) S-adenosylmethionine ribosyltransferase-isomerase QueA [Thermosipho]EKF48736.1 S-adenosylmethionine:tRNA ribosyltransferase-isomerase [Thermosipho africanus H17ap60334]MBZ4649331.1 queA [Thermosipho sp. (in: thermotogales)]MDK2839703.1 S-adenosylmethionine:tRNA ribosyltransferase-isomerase [Thermosipho sp. (in: thermotogales)]HCF38308.1 tRNA preQ1(34) S-adenosylmethionine ribosyltransferase-isomerase QueA [Thermosipho africanus]